MYKVNLVSTKETTISNHNIYKTALTIFTISK